MHGYVQCNFRLELGYQNIFDSLENAGKFCFLHEVQLCIPRGKDRITEPVFNFLFEILVSYTVQYYKQIACKLVVCVIDSTILLPPTPPPLIPLF